MMVRLISIMLQIIINMKKLLIFISFIFLFTQCKEESVDPSLSRVEEYYIKWKSFGIDSYSIIQTKECFCVDRGIKAIVVVRNDKIISVEDSTGVVQIPQERWQYFKTINQLFETAIDAQKKKPANFIIEYDDNYKFPTYLYVNPSSSVIDEEYAFVTSNFQPIK